MKEFLMSFSENITFLSLAICILSLCVMFLLLYIRVESIHKAFEKVGLNAGFFIKMIIASIACFVMSLVVITLGRNPVCIPICITLLLASFLLISHIRVLEIKSDGDQK